MPLPSLDWKHRKPVLARLLARHQSPPPWLWLSHGKLWQRQAPSDARRLPLECLQQLHWWLIRPWRQARRPASLQALPRALSWRACWLNSYRPAEVAWWWALGVRHWWQLAQHTPDSLAWAVHAQRRQHWPDHCRTALALLSDKAALLARTPERWRAPFLVMPASAQPPWWSAAINGPGVVLKPQRGHGGRAVLRFWCQALVLQQQALFHRLPAAAPLLPCTSPPHPDTVLRHWHSLCHTHEPALAAPYLEHSSALPPAEPSVVVRVITARSSPDGPVQVRLAWLEVPLGAGAVAFISCEGHHLPRPGTPLNAAQQQSQARWQVLLRSGTPGCIRACLQAATAMHARLPPIDQVAWDWIPADPQPLLLEGNGGFGLLVPQLFEHANSLLPP